MKITANPSSLGTVVSVRGSVVDIRFEAHLPPIYSLLYARSGKLSSRCARLDEDTRKIIEHGRRIRACLKQPEFSPVSMPAQIAVLLALTAELFEPLPLDQMTDAEHALLEAASDIPAEVRERLDTAEELSDEDRETILRIARKSLARFQPEEGSKSGPEPVQNIKEQPKPESEAAPKTGPKSETGAD